MSEQKEKSKGCPDDCNALHFVEEFADIYGVHPSTVWRWKKRGLPYSETTKRIPCKKAREWLTQTVQAA